MKNKEKDQQENSEIPAVPEDLSAGNANHISLPKDEYESLLQRIQDLEETKEKMLRSAAEFENAKKRLAKERDEFVRFSLENLIRELLPVLDNFERALSHIGEPKDPQTKGVLLGIQMVFKQLNDLLKNQGLIRLETQHKKFDPHFHEAIGHIFEDGEEDVIVEEIQPGYLLHDRLVRAAKVRVRAKPTITAENETEAEEKDEEIT